MLVVIFIASNFPLKIMFDRIINVVIRKECKDDVSIWKYGEDDRRKERRENI